MQKSSPKCARYVSYVVLKWWSVFCMRIGSHISLTTLVLFFIFRKDLGAGLSVAELEAAFLDLDSDDDGQIFFDEFSQWWLNFSRAKMLALQECFVWRKPSLAGVHGLGCYKVLFCSRQGYCWCVNFCLSTDGFYSFHDGGGIMVGDLTMARIITVHSAPYSTIFNKTLCSWAIWYPPQCSWTWLLFFS